MAQNKQTVIQKVIQTFYPYFWRKFKFFDEDDAETECQLLAKTLREAVWVHRIVSLWQWRQFLASEANLIPMTSSLEAYLSCLYFMISTTIKDITSIHESFLTTCSLVTAVAAYVYNRGYHEFLEYCSDILMLHIEENYSKEWKKIQDHFFTCRCVYSAAYQMVENKSKGNPFADMLSELDFVAKIKNMIKSELSIGEDAAVYRHTTEVIARFKTRTSQNPSLIKNRVITSKVNASIQTEGSLENIEGQRKSDSGQRISTEHIELINLKISHSLRGLEEMLMDEVKSVGKLNENEVLRNKRELSLKLQNFLQDVHRPRNSEDEQSFTRTEAINSNPTSSYLTEQRLEELEMLDKEQKTPIGDTKTFNLEISPSRSVEQSLQEMEKQSTFQNEEAVASLEKKTINLEQISTSQPEIPLSLDVERQDRRERKISEIQQSSTSLTDTEAVGLKQTSSPQSKLFLQDASEQKIPEDRQRTSSLTDTGAVSLTQIFSLLEQTFQEKRSLKVSENEQSSYMEEEIDAFEVVCSSFYSEEQSIKDMEKSEKLDDEEIASVLEEPEASILKHNSPIQMGQSFQEDLGKPRIIESEQNHSVAEETGDMNLKQEQLPSQEQEQLPSQEQEQLPSQEQKQEQLPSQEQSTAIDLSFRKFSSDDDNSRFEISNPTDENYSDTLHVTEESKYETHSQQTTKKKKKKPKKSKGKKQTSAKVENCGAANSNIASYSEQQSLGNNEKQRDVGASFPIPSKQEALYASLFLLKKLNNSLNSVKILLKLP